MKLSFNKIICLQFLVLCQLQLEAQTYVGAIGDTLQLGQFRAAKGIAIDLAGNTFVGDALTNTITKFDASGTAILRWGGSGTGNGKFNFLREGTFFLGLATDQSGNVYVVDVGNNRIQVFTNNGVFISLFAPAFPFSTPSGIAIDAAGNVFISETGSALVHKFTGAGLHLNTWGGQGTGDGQFGDINAWGGATGMATDGDGNVYVADGPNSRIEKFDNNGNFLLQFGSPGNGDGMFLGEFGYLGIAVDTVNQLVYVSDPLNHRVEQFDTNGDYKSTFGLTGIPSQANGSFAHPLSLAVNSSGNILVVEGLSYCLPCTDNNRIQEFSKDGNYISQFGTGPKNPGQLAPANPLGYQMTLSVATDADGNLYVSDQNNHRIQKFDQDGNSVTTWGSFGNGDGEFYYPQGITTDATGNVWGVDFANFRVQKFSSSGSFITSFGTNGSTNGLFLYPQGISLDADGNIYVADTQNHRIQKFDATYAFVTTWGSQGAGDGQFDMPVEVAADGNGNVYVADRNNNRVQKFDHSGTFLSSWAVPGIRSITVDASGRVFTGGQGVSIFDAYGNLLSQLNNPGSGPGQFQIVADIALGESDKVLYVADPQNFRIQKFVFPLYYQTITFNSLSPVTYGSGPFTLTATSSSGLPITYTSSDPSVATITGNVVTIIGAGSVTITASQSGDQNYYAAVNVQQSLTVNKADQTINFASLGNVTVGGPDFSLTASASSGLAVTYSSSNPSLAAINGNTVIIGDAGSVTITAVQPGNNNFNAATPVNQTFCINPAKPEISLSGTPSSPLLTSSATSGNQWYLNGTAITGETNNSISIGESGSYTVQVSVDNCVSEMSDAKAMVITGDINTPTGRSLVIYPNPVINVLAIRVTGISENEPVSATIYNVLGKSISSVEVNGDGAISVDASSFASGTYVVKVIQSGRIIVGRFTKQ